MALQPWQRIQSSFGVQVEQACKIEPAPQGTGSSVLIDWFVTGPVRLLDGDGKRLGTLASARVGVGGDIQISAHGQRNAVDLTRGRCVLVGAGPAPRAAAGGLRTEVHNR